MHKYGNKVISEIMMSHTVYDLQNIPRLLFGAAHEPQLYINIELFNINVDNRPEI